MESEKNKKLIKEFERLVSFIQHELDESISNQDKSLQNKQTFRLKQFKNVLLILKKYPKEITLNNLAELKEYPGIGEGTIKRILEILDKGKLSELGEFKDEKKEKKKAIEDLLKVIGIGRSHAIELIDQGVKNVEDLKKKVKQGKIQVNDKIILGLKYYGIFEEHIPRDEMDKINKFLMKKIKQFNEAYETNDKNKFILQVCGSYRRLKPYSNDIDVLISKLGTKENDKNEYLPEFINLLRKPSKTNNEKPFLVDDMTDKNYNTKYMGFCKYKDKPIRRIDIRFLPYESYPSALLYFTGSGDFNKKMRQLAKAQGYLLSEYGLFDKNGKIVPAKTEKDIFDKLGMTYVPPEERV